MDFLERMLRFELDEIPIVVLTLLIAFTVHEFAHAFTAYKFGDETAKKQGRLTLNPLQHIDPLGMILILFVGFGWAKPVPVNRYFFKNPRLASILVSLMGPVSNLLMAIIGAAIFYTLAFMGVAGSFPPIVIQFFDLFIYFNVLLFVFNLLPIPPLDGYRIVEDLVSKNVRAKMTQYEQYGALIFLILVFTPLGAYTIYPVLYKVIPFVVESVHNMFVIFL